MAERITREELPHPAVDNPLDIFEEWFIKATSDIIELTGIHHPERLPAIFKSNVNPDKPGFKEFERKGPSHKLLLGKSNIWRRVVKTFTMEYQFPLQHLWAAVQALEDSIALAARKAVYVAAPIQFRFTKKSERSFLTHLLHQPTVSFSVSFFRKHEGAHTWLRRNLNADLLRSKVSRTGARCTTHLRRSIRSLKTFATGWIRPESSASNKRYTRRMPRRFSSRNDLHSSNTNF